MPVKSKPPVRPVCGHCLSGNIAVDASARWDSELRDWSMSGVHDADEATCDDCQAERTILWLRGQRVCRHCGEPVRWRDHDGVWVHDDPDEDPLKFDYGWVDCGALYGRDCSAEPLVPDHDYEREVPGE